jgi:hypothetical protein
MDIYCVANTTGAPPAQDASAGCGGKLLPGLPDEDAVEIAGSEAGRIILTDPAGARTEAIEVRDSARARAKRGTIDPARVNSNPVQIRILDPTASDAEAAGGAVYAAGDATPGGEIADAACRNAEGHVPDAANRIADTSACPTRACTNMTDTLHDTRGASPIESLRSYACLSASGSGALPETSAHDAAAWRQNRRRLGERSILAEGLSERCRSRQADQRQEGQGHTFAHRALLRSRAMFA